MAKPAKPERMENLSMLIQPIDHFTMGYYPFPTDDWLFAVVYFDCTNVEASSWLYVYDPREM